MRIIKESNNCFSAHQVHDAHILFIVGGKEQQSTNPLHIVCENNVISYVQSEHVDTGKVGGVIRLYVIILLRVIRNAHERPYHCFMGTSLSENQFFNRLIC